MQNSKLWQFKSNFANTKYISIISEQMSSLQYIKWARLKGLQHPNSWCRGALLKKGWSQDYVHMKLVGFLYCRTPLSLFLYFIDRFESQPFFIHMLVRMRICSQEQFYIWTSVCLQYSTWTHILLTIEVSFEHFLQTVMSVSKSMAHEREKLMCLEFSPPLI